VYRCRIIRSRKVGDAAEIGTTNFCLGAGRSENDLEGDDILAITRLVSVLVCVLGGSTGFRRSDISILMFSVRHVSTDHDYPPTLILSLSLSLSLSL
jgi:hypothetical protein